jgi:integrase
MAVVDALRMHKARQAEDRLLAGALWQDHGLVFPSAVGTPLPVRRIGENWTPRELRHTFVSIMSEQGVPVEENARLVGHSTTSTTETASAPGASPGLQPAFTHKGFAAARMTDKARTEAPPAALSW